MELENKEMEALESKGTGFAYFETCVENVMNYCPHFIQCEDYQTIQAYTFLNIMCKKKKISILVCQSCMPHYCLGIHNTLAAASSHLHGKDCRGGMTVILVCMTNTEECTHL